MAVSDRQRVRRPRPETAASDPATPGFAGPAQPASIGRQRESTVEQEIRDPRITDAGELLHLPERHFENWYEIRKAARDEYSKLLQEDKTNEQRLAHPQAFIDFVSNLVRGRGSHLSVGNNDLNLLARFLHIELFGLGTLQLFLDIPGLEDVFLVRWDTLDVVIDGTKHRVSPTGFSSDDDVLQFLQSRVFGPINKALTRANPSENAILPDGSRMIAFHDPISPYTSFAVRRHKQEVFKDVQTYFKTGIAPADFFQDLNVWVKTMRNVVMSGATGSGKTTMTNVAASLVPENERILTLEDTPEMQINHFRVQALYTYEKGARAGSDDGNSVPMSDLLRYALRAKPDRIIVGEVREREALDMLDALNTGHAGSMTTLHSNSPVDALTRLQMMCARHPAMANIPSEVLMDLIASVLDIIVQIRYVPGIGRRVISAEQVLYANHYRNSRHVLTGEGTEQIYERLYLRPLYRWENGELVKVADFIAPDHDTIASDDKPLNPEAAEQIRANLT